MIHVIFVGNPYSDYCGNATFGTACRRPRLFATAISNVRIGLLGLINNKCVECLCPSMEYSKNDIRIIGFNDPHFCAAGVKHQLTIVTR